MSTGPNRVDTAPNTVVEQRTTDRQTPKTDFGTRIKVGTSNALGTINSAASVAAPFVPGGAVISAAVVGVSSMSNGGDAGMSSNSRVASGGMQPRGATGSSSGGANMGGFGPSYAAPPPGGSGSSSSGIPSGGASIPTMGGGIPGVAGSTGGGAAGGDPSGFLEANRQSNMQFLQLQSSIAQESQQYMTISQVMKARDDAAKNTIHNTGG